MTLLYTPFIKLPPQSVALCNGATLMFTYANYSFVFRQCKLVGQLPDWSSSTMCWRPSCTATRTVGVPNVSCPVKKLHLPRESYASGRGLPVVPTNVSQWFIYCSQSLLQPAFTQLGMQLMLQMVIVQLQQVHCMQCMQPAVPALSVLH